MTPARVAPCLMVPERPGSRCAAQYNGHMRYLVTARLKPGKGDALRAAIDDGSLGRGSVAGDEYGRNMDAARQLADGRVQWVEVCFCTTPLAEEREYWEEFFDLVDVRDAHARSRCRDLDGSEPWACCECDCTDRLEARLDQRGKRFLEDLPIIGSAGL